MAVKTGHKSIKTKGGQWFFTKVRFISTWIHFHFHLHFHSTVWLLGFATAFLSFTEIPQEQDLHTFNKTNNSLARYLFFILYTGNLQYIPREERAAR